jgi:hypothetical protein
VQLIGEAAVCVIIIIIIIIIIGDCHASVQPRDPRVMALYRIM